jgi:hypothetical protein
MEDVDRIRYERPSDVTDLLLFEHRMTEVISHWKPTARRWRAILFGVFACTIYSSYYWIIDPSIRFVSLWESLSNHPLFTLSFLLLTLLFIVCGVHKRVIAAKIIAARCRTVLADFSLSCDESGKLIVRPAYSSDRLSNFAL